MVVGDEKGREERGIIVIYYLYCCQTDAGGKYIVGILETQITNSLALLT